MKNQTQKQTGFAAIEYTLAAPLMFLLIFAVAEFGRLLYQYNILTQAVRDAGRYLSNSARPGTTGIIELTDDNKTRTEKLLRYGDLTSNQLLLPNLNNAVITYSSSGDLVSINVSYPWQPIFASNLFDPDGQGMSLDFPLVANYTVRAL